MKRAPVHLWLVLVPWVQPWTAFLTAFLTAIECNAAVALHKYYTIHDARRIFSICAQLGTSALPLKLKSGICSSRFLIAKMRMLKNAMAAKAKLPQLAMRNAI